MAPCKNFRVCYVFEESLFLLTLSANNVSALVSFVFCVSVRVKITPITGILHCSIKTPQVRSCLKIDFLYLGLTKMRSSLIGREKK